MTAAPTNRAATNAAPTNAAATNGRGVVMVVRLYHPWIGGTERQAQKLARALRDDGMDVTVLTGRWFAGTPVREVVDGVTVVRHGTLQSLQRVRGMGTVGGYVYLLTLCWHLWRLRKRYDVIHVHGLNYHTWGAVQVGRRLHKPVLAKLANSGAASDVLKMRENRQLRGARRLLSGALRCDRFVALNPDVVHELRAEGVDAERIVELPNGVDIPAEIDRSSRTGPVTLLYLGRLHPQKALETLLAAVAELQARRPGLARLRLVGEGPMAEELHALTARLGLADVVHFAGPTDDVAPELAAADVFVLPSRVEGLSNALLEALAAGLPAVVSDIPGNAQVVEHGRHGLLVTVDDVAGLADALERLVTDPALRAELGRAGAASVAARYGMARVVADYRRLYRQLAQGLTEGTAWTPSSTPTASSQPEQATPAAEVAR